jgi:hypothetical protein
MQFSDLLDTHLKALYYLTFRKTHMSNALYTVHDRKPRLSPSFLTNTGLVRFPRVCNVPSQPVRSTFFRSTLLTHLVCMYGNLSTTRRVLQMLSNRAREKSQRARRMMYLSMMLLAMPRSMRSASLVLPMMVRQMRCSGRIGSKILVEGSARYSAR